MSEPIDQAVKTIIRDAATRLTPQEVEAIVVIMKSAPLRNMDAAEAVMRLIHRFLASVAPTVPEATTPGD